MTRSTFAAKNEKAQYREKFIPRQRVKAGWAHGASGNLLLCVDAIDENVTKAAKCHAEGAGEEQHESVHAFSLARIFPTTIGALQCESSRATNEHDEPGAGIRKTFTTYWL